MSFAMSNDIICDFVIIFTTICFFIPLIMEASFDELFFIQCF